MLSSGKLYVAKGGKAFCSCAVYTCSHLSEMDNIIEIQFDYLYYSKRRVTPLFISTDELLSYSYDGFCSRMLQEVPHIAKMLLPAESLRMILAEENRPEIDLSHKYFQSQIARLVNKGLKTIVIRIAANESPLPAQPTGLANSRGSWVVGRMSWVVGKMSWVVGKKSWVVGKKSWVVGKKSWVVGKKSWVVGKKSWVPNKKSWVPRPPRGESPRNIAPQGGESPRNIAPPLGYSPPHINFEFLI